ncbi:FAD-binding protein [Rhizophagus clarus]|uniref:FAD-binding protein n=1 Tax=Rhizophagus clarus TaxID=94130 RepID=A0A8H3L8K6_9GLOM|nr:FAD-binding protein [Rhizophagus clarus]
MGRVAIIGAGPSGLVAAKSAIECGLNPVVFEQASTYGGIWRPRVQGGFIWNNMHANLSYYCGMFSDYSWNNEADCFPSQQAIYEYLGKYIDEFKLKSYLRFNTSVISIKKHENIWQVDRLEGGENKTEEFEYIIVATGIFTEPYVPDIKGSEEFEGEVLHSKEYDVPNNFRNKKVVVIGGAFSGAEISAEIATTTLPEKVINIINEPFCVLKRYVPYKTHHSPVDLVLYIRAKEGPQRREEITKLGYCHNSNSQEPHGYIIADSYEEEVKGGRISIVEGKIQEFKKESIIVNGTEVPADIVIFATGYKLKLPFFDEAITKKLEFFPDDQLQPLILHKATFHLIYITWLFGKISLPEYEVMLKGLEEERKIRNKKPRPQFPHGDYINFADDIAKEIKVLPDFDELRRNNPHVYELFLEGPMVGSNYRYSGFGSNPELAVKLSEKARKALEQQSK